MKRLTSNKDVSDIDGMYELAHNSCYIDKDGNTRYRDFESDVDARVLTRELLKKYADGDDAFISDDDFDEQMMEALQYGTDTREGLIALFYRNLWAMAELRERLKGYEDAEEQGLLLKLPCPFGTKIYCIHNGIIEEGMFFEMSCFKFKDYYKKSWFLTREEAEQALAEMKG